MDRKESNMDVSTNVADELVDRLVDRYWEYLRVYRCLGTQPDEEHVWNSLEDVMELMPAVIKALGKTPPTVEEVQETIKHE